METGGRNRRYVVEAHEKYKIAADHLCYVFHVMCYVNYDCNLFSHRAYRRFLPRSR